MILIVGNILKDVYLSLDSRTESFETDKNGVKWLDFGFDTSSHHYFHRNSSFGGAAVSLEVLEKLGLNAKINSSDLVLNNDEPSFAKPSDYRYILTSEDSVSYLVPTSPSNTLFEKPATVPDYLYIDRSANLSEPVIKDLIAYLSEHKNIKLILYVKDPDQTPMLTPLINRAQLVITENTTANFDYERTIFISDRALSYKNLVEPITIERIDKLTHLSAFSIAAATIVGSFLLEKTVAESLKFAKLNVENSNLDSTLTLRELTALQKTGGDESLELIAATLMAPKKGILAADESGGSIKKKFAQLNIADTFENRHDYRNIFFTTENIENYLNGIILFDETAHDFMSSGESIPDFLISHRIMPGIKVDQGLEKFKDSDETYTKGLEDLKPRLRKYREMGLRFAKWRAAFTINPSEQAISENCRILAEYAAACQSAGLVPIVEPELVYDGDYSIEESAETTGKILDRLILELKNYDVSLSACIIKCNMVLAGKKYHKKSTKEEVGRTTAEVLKNHVPKEIAGIVFLSGGQTETQATENLAAIISCGPFPWPLTFSFARALQDPVLHAWAGNNDNLEKARQAFLDRLIANTEIL